MPMQLPQDKSYFYYLCVHVIIFVAVYVFLWPPMYTIIDENNYLEMAYVLRAGHIFPDELGLRFSFLLPHNDHLVSIYPIGTSILLIPFTYFGWRATFLLNFSLHLMAFFIFIKLLKYVGLPRIYSLLYLYYPASVLYMRTLMSDIPSSFFVLAGCYAYFLDRKWLYLSGTLLGFSCLIRHTNWIVVIAICLAIIVKSLKDYGLTLISLLLTRLWKFLAGFVPFSLIVFYYNYYTVGSIWKNPYNFISGNGNPFNIALLPNNFKFYFYSLMIFYPLMLCTLFAAKIKHRVLLNGIFWALFILYCCNLNYHSWGPQIYNYVIGVRYLLPVIFIPILTYAAILTVLNNRVKKLGMVLFVALNLLCVPYIALSAKHYSYAKEWDVFRQTIYSDTEDNALILADPDASKLFSHVWGKRKVEIYVHYNRKYPVEQKINEALLNKSNVYLALILRPSRDEFNRYALAYKNEILSKYSHTQIRSIKLPSGNFLLFKIMIGSKPDIRHSSNAFWNSAAMGACGNFSKN